jgi:hypothetical protein
VALSQFPSQLWSDSPRERLDSARSLSVEQVLALQSELSRSAPSQPWPYGMPTSVNPYLLVLGASPGASPDSTDPGGAYAPPTAGEPHPGLFYNDTRGYWAKIRGLMVSLLQSVDPRVSAEDCLALAGQLNFSTGQSGLASEAVLDPAYARWVPEAIGSLLQPRLVILVGLSGLLKSQAFTGMIPSSPHWPSEWRREKEVRFRGYASKSLQFRSWTRYLPDGGHIKYLAWPNHPSRSPFSNLALWSTATQEAAEYLREGVL